MPMVMAGKRIWKDTVKANCIRAEARANQKNYSGASKDLSDLRRARFQGGNGTISVSEQPINITFKRIITESGGASIV